jgi:hypothetical protein
MSTLARSLVTWKEFLRLPERPQVSQRYELQDGEVVSVPLARPLHINFQKRIELLLEARAGDRGVVTIEFPYHPVVNLQYWFADVAYVPKPDWDALPPHNRRRRHLRALRRNTPPGVCYAGMIVGMISTAISAGIK